MKKGKLYIALLLLCSATIKPIANDPDLEDFTMVEVGKEPAKKAKLDVEDAKKLLISAEKKLQSIQTVAESKELSTTIKATKSMIEALRKLVFKNGPGFEINNKTGNDIWVTVISNGKIKTHRGSLGCDKIPAGERLTFDMYNLQEDMKFGVYTKDPIAVSYSAQKGEFKPAPHYVYETTEGAKGKTKYFTWNPEKHHKPSKYLYPQTGRLAGLAKGSSSGYLLSNNIKEHQISLTEANEGSEE